MTDEPVAVLRLTVYAIPWMEGTEDGPAALLVGLGLPDDPPPPSITADEVCRMLLVGLGDGSIQASMEDAWRTMRAEAN
jgi:hypothetical protein